MTECDIPERSLASRCVPVSSCFTWHGTVSYLPFLHTINGQRKDWPSGYMAKHCTVSKASEAGTSHQPGAFCATEFLCMGK